MKTTNTYGYVRVAAVVPELKLGDVGANVDVIVKAYQAASTSGAQVVVFPELCLTGYTIADLVQQKTLLRSAVEGLQKLAKFTTDKAVAVVGLPFSAGGKLYNVAAVLAGGKIVGIVPKTYLPNYQEFY